MSGVFLIDLVALMTILNSTDPHFVRSHLFSTLTQTSPAGASCPTPASSLVA